MISFLFAANAAMITVTDLDAAQSFQTQYEFALAAGRMQDACVFADNVLVLADADGATASPTIGPDIIKQLASQIVTACGNAAPLAGVPLAAAILRSQATHHMLAAWGQAVSAGAEKRRKQ